MENILTENIENIENSSSEDSEDLKGLIKEINNIKRKISYIEKARSEDLEGLYIRGQVTENIENSSSEDLKGLIKDLNYIKRKISYIEKARSEDLEGLYRRKQELYRLKEIKELEILYGIDKINDTIKNYATHFDLKISDGLIWSIIHSTAGVSGWMNYNNESE
jgi:hypothetical protein